MGDADDCLHEGAEASQQGCVFLKPDGVLRCRLLTYACL